MSDIENRLDTLESKLEQQQETIEEQQRTIARQRNRLKDLAKEGADGEEGGGIDSSSMMTCRGALTAGGLLALVFGGVGTASADSQGQVGTSQDPLDGLYTDDLYGNSGTITLQDALDLANSDSIQDAGTDAIQFDGNQNVTIPNGTLDLNGNDVRLTEDFDLDMQPGLDKIEFKDKNNSQTTLRIGTGTPGVLSLMNANLRVKNSNSITDNFGDAFLTINSGGPLGVNKSLDLNSNNVEAVASIDGGGSAIGVGDDVDLGGANLKDSSGDLTLNPSGKVKADAYYTNSVEIGEDSYHSFTPLEKLGKIIVHDSDTAVGEVLFDITDDTHAPATAKVSDLHGSYIETTTGELDGTTGTDGNLIISAAVGKIYIENRFNGSTTVRYTVIQ